jgi:hypothetical protein
VNHLLVSRISDLDGLALFLLSTSLKEVGERFRETIGLVLQDLTMDSFKANILSLDVRYVIVQIAPRQRASVELVGFFVLCQKYVV